MPTDKNGFPIPETQAKVNLNINEEAVVGQGKYAHIFTASYNLQAEHYVISFFQETDHPMPDGSKQVNRYLVSRIFLTKSGLNELGKLLTNLNNMVNRPNLPESSGTPENSL